MTGYLINFTVYTAAMVGIIFLALFVYKKVSQGYGMTSKSKFLGVEDSINLAPRKNMYIVRAGNERFLVASDADRTTLISKLDDNHITADRQINNIVHREKQQVQAKINPPKKSSVDELPTIVDFPKKERNNTVFKNIVSGIND